MLAVATRPENRVLLGDNSSVPGPKEEIELTTGDQFCEQHGISNINFLKIDTEGFDLKVCAGFVRMLAKQDIDLLQVEAGMHAGNQLHVPFEAFKAYLEPLGYSVFRIYNQSLERNRPQLRRSNIVFVSETQVRRHTIAKHRPQASPAT
jgi:hypothetical protein